MIVVGRIVHDDGPRRDHDVVSDPDRAEHHGIGAERDIVADHDLARAHGPALATDAVAANEVEILANDGSVVDDDPERRVRDPESFADRRMGADVTASRPRSDEKKQGKQRGVKDSPPAPEGQMQTPGRTVASDGHRRWVEPAGQPAPGVSLVQHADVVVQKSDLAQPFANCRRHAGLPSMVRMRLVALQPVYLPWLGYFDQMQRSDLFVFFDDGQYTRHNWRNRNRIKAPDGRPYWLTVPVRHNGVQRIMDVAVDNSQPWARRHINLVKTFYTKSPFLKRYLPELEELLHRPWEFLVELDLAVIELMCDWLGLRARTARNSEVVVRGDAVSWRSTSACALVRVGPSRGTRQRVIST
jgi:hypothetical protein